MRKPAKIAIGQVDRVTVKAGTGDLNGVPLQDVPLSAVAKGLIVLEPLGLAKHVSFTRSSSSAFSQTKPFP